MSKNAQIWSGVNGVGAIHIHTGIRHNEQDKLDNTNTNTNKRTE